MLICLLNLYKLKEAVANIVNFLILTKEKTPDVSGVFISNHCANNNTKTNLNTYTPRIYGSLLQFENIMENFARANIHVNFIVRFLSI
jgi:hypothetical protein